MNNSIPQEMNSVNQLNVIYTCTYLLSCIIYVCVISLWREVPIKQSCMNVYTYYTFVLVNAMCLILSLRYAYTLILYSQILYVHVNMCSKPYTLVQCVTFPPLQPVMRGSVLWMLRLLTPSLHGMEKQLLSQRERGSDSVSSLL